MACRLNHGAGDTAEERDRTLSEAKENQLDLNRVVRPARYTGHEWNAVVKDWRGKVSFALAYPDLYEVGMSHLGSQILYHELNRRPDVAAERVYTPARDMETALRGEGELLRSLESQRPLREFAFVGFTLQYELTYTNILTILSLGGVPLSAGQRREGDPLVVAGGPGAFNPEPLADFLDLVVLGEGEEVVHELVDLYLAWLRAGGTGGRREFLRRAAGLGGVYVPSLYRVEYREDGLVRGVHPLEEGIPARVVRRVVADLDGLSYPVRPVVPNCAVVHDRAMVEIFRGCTRGCRFCQAGIIYRPVRERSPAVVRELAGKIVANTGYDELSLSSLSTSDYSGIEGLVADLGRDLGPLEVGISLPSLRVDSFAVALSGKTAGRKSITLAPEAGTQRLRNVINKGVTEEDILAAVGEAVASGWEGIKLYFMIGLPTEGEEDLDGILTLGRRIKSLTGKGRRRPPRVTLSVSAFVPKPQTPFQWEPQLPPAEMSRRLHYLKSGARKLRLDFHWHEPDQAFLEAALARGDRRLGRVLTEAWEQGCRLDGWAEEFAPGKWEEAFVSAGLVPAFYASRERERDEVFPWDHLDAGVGRDFLWEERSLSRGGEITPDCRWGSCSDCGACPELGVGILQCR